MRQRFALLLIVLAAAGGCRRGSPPPPAPSAPSAQTSWSSVAETAVLFYDNSGGFQDSTRMVVRDEAGLRQVWQQATSRLSSPLELPAVDFTREMLLVVGAGRMAPDDEIHVDSIALRSDPAARQESLTAVVRTTQSCRRFNADAYPLEIVRVRRIEGPVEFVERREQQAGCR